VQDAGEIAALTFEVSIEQLAAADALLELLGALCVSQEPGGDEEILEPEPGTTPQWQRTRVRALFPSSTHAATAAKLLREQIRRDVAIAIEAITEAEWLDASKIDPHELEIGQRLLIGTANTANEHGGRTLVRLHRGLGFGTGEHPTTALCLEWLEAELEPGASIIDYGCGSGVLAVTALCLGARRAFAVDIEPQAITATIANAELNGVGNRLWTGPPDRLPAQTADIVIANILAGPLIELAPRLTALTARSGVIVLTGLLVDQLATIENSYARSFADLVTTERDGWIRVVGRRATD
jgi:ribosomal protein L11 methyltransferase